MRPTSLALLPRESLLRTGAVDHADWNYRPILGYIQRYRFRIALNLLPPTRVGRLLEIGYGSGIFLPELSKHCGELVGVDMHGHAADVGRLLSRFGVPALLLSSGAHHVDLASGSIDCAVAISALEFVDDLPAVCREVVRLLAVGGTFVVVTPGQSPLVDAGLKLLTRQSARHDFAQRRTRLLDILLEHFSPMEVREFPPVGGRLLRLYTGLRLVPRPSPRPGPHVD